MDEAYSKRTNLDDMIHAYNTIKYDGFDPFFWIPRKEMAAYTPNNLWWVVTDEEKQKATDEIMIGQAFGL